MDINRRISIQGKLAIEIGVFGFKIVLRIAINKGAYVVFVSQFLSTLYVEVGIHVSYF